LFGRLFRLFGRRLGWKIEVVAVPVSASGERELEVIDALLAEPITVRHVVEALARAVPDDVPIAPSRPSRRDFLRLTDVPGDSLDERVAVWHQGVVRGLDVVAVERAGTRWVITARFRRYLRRVPVVIELWPVHDRWSMMTMTPRRRVAAGRGYFRAGHRAMDRLAAALRP
jgi:hypothetical protein